MQTLKSKSTKRISKNKKKRLSNKLKEMKYSKRRNQRNSFKIENNPKELARLIAERLKKFTNSTNKTKSLYSKPGIFNIKEDQRE
jgi:hypothetical protein